MTKTHARDRILDALLLIIGEQGLSAASLEAVADRAGISKGGLLYYFPNKKDLLVSMIDRYAEIFFRERDAIIATMPETKNRTLKASVILMLKNMEAASETIPNLMTALDDAALRQRVGEFKREMLRDCCDHLDNKGRIVLILYIIDGLWNDIGFDPTVVEKPVRDEVVKELMTLVDSLEE